MAQHDRLCLSAVRMRTSRVWNAVQSLLYSLQRLMRVRRDTIVLGRRCMENMVPSRRQWLFLFRRSMATYAAHVGTSSFLPSFSKNTARLNVVSASQDRKLLVGDNKADEPNFRHQRQRAENRKEDARVGRGTQLLRFKHPRSAGDETAPRPRNACSHSHTRAQIGVCETDCRSRKGGKCELGAACEPIGNGLARVFGFGMSGVGDFKRWIGTLSHGY